MTDQVTGSAPETPLPPTDEAPAAQPSLLGELTVPLVLAAFATYLLVGLLSMEVPDSVDFPGPRFFPAVIVAVIYVLVVLEVLGALRRRAAWHRTSASTSPASPGQRPEKATTFSWRSFAWVVGGFLIFSLTLEFLGWIIGAAMLFWFVARGFGDRRPVLSLVVGLTLSSLAYIAFDMALGLSLPSGILGGGF